MTHTMTTVRDLRNWVDAALGSDGTQQIIDAVTAYIQKNDHPAWGADWTAFLESLDIWHIVTGLGL